MCTVRLSYPRFGACSFPMRYLVWMEARVCVYLDVEELSSPDNWMDVILRSVVAWRRVEELITRIMKI